MKTLVIAIACLIVGFGAAFLVLPESQTPDASVTKAAPQLYTCGMHPEIISPEPGVCPICNMKLTPKRDGGTNAQAIRIDAAARQNMGLVTSRAAHRAMARTVRTFGQVVIPDPNRHSLNVKVNGWVETLHVAEEGERVHRGQPLVEIYAPDLVATQRELLVALNRDTPDPAMARLVGIAEDRLRNWDISEDQLERLKQNGEISRTMVIRSPADGFVLTKYVNEGDRVSDQSTLYEIADLTTVWVKAYVYEQDLPYVEVGQTGSVTTPGLPGQTFQARLTFVSPVLHAGSQAEVRFTLDNRNFALKPEMYAEVTLKGRVGGERLAVPRSAVIHSGARQIVFVAASDDQYEARHVITGLVDDADMIEITDGLAAGDAVVVSGQFLLDSETRLNEAIDGGPRSDHRHDGSDAPQEHSDAEAARHAQPGSAGGVSDPYDIHTCPMPVHFHVLTYGPGACPDCGMDLVPIEGTEHAPVFVCPMSECGVVQDEPGSCPHCNMNLVEYKPESYDDQ
jgi:Cu(I)/Ag(I) efflux system membrane fusion protein/cobalt-zinc-cadmium efflux system membrane fusion protein